MKSNENFDELDGTDMLADGLVEARTRKNDTQR